MINILELSTFLNRTNVSVGHEEGPGGQLVFNVLFICTVLLWHWRPNVIFV